MMNSKELNFFFFFTLNRMYFLMYHHSHLSLSYAIFSASSSFCRETASLSPVRSNSLSTSWILRFRDATSLSACSK